MKKNNQKISHQIYLWLGALFFIILGFVASMFFSMDKLWQNTSGLYNHPLTVRRAVGAMEVDVLYMHGKMLHLLGEADPSAVDAFIQEIDSYESDAYRQLDVLYDRYLGPKSELDAISDSLAQWKTIRVETIHLYRSGEVALAQTRVSELGADGAQFHQIMEQLGQVSDFAKDKGDEFYTSALAARDANTLRISLLSAGVLLVVVLAGTMLRRGILPPLQTLTQAADSMRQGDLSVRVNDASTNEIGVLSSAFNTMAATIQAEMQYKEDLASVSAALSKATELRSFSRELIQTLMCYTGSQLGAVYVLNEQTNVFEPYESLGAKQGSLRPFSAATREGEFGAAIASRSIRHISQIPADVQVVFSSVSGDYRVKDIVTIPIVSGSEVILIISLASIQPYSQESIRLLAGVYSEISARFATLSSWQKILDMSERLKTANQELQQQAKELELQTTELTEQNTELEIQKTQLDEASRLKTNFLSSMSHELRTPLNSVIALTGVLRRRLAGKLPDEEFGFLEVIERNGKGLLGLINDILDISRIEAGHEEIEIEAFSVTAVTSDVVNMIRPQATQKGIELTLESSADVTIFSDIDKYRHILQNLVANAVKFTEKGKVSVSVQAREQQVEIHVVDTGIGISEADLPFVFDEFRQADGGTARRFGGAGLGLAISKKYADLVGGAIQATSKLGVGSDFSLTLPMQFHADRFGAVRSASSRLAPALCRTPPMKQSDFSDKTILIIEDNEAAVIQLKDLIGSLGCRVLCAQHADEAFQILGRTIPDAMILDLMMPEVDGFAVLEILRNAEITAHVPVLILTAKQITKDELKFLKRNNIHQFIQKGDVNIEELKRAITGMLEQKSAKPVATPPKNSAAANPPTVLVVEDNADNMTTIRALLSEQYTVIEAVNGQDCLTAVAKHTPDLILMDIALPDMSGIEVFHQLKTLGRLAETPVVALTASAMRQDREAILAHGFEGFIAKPIVEKEFYRVIEGVLYGK